jgi:hypothetical protein
MSAAEALRAARAAAIQLAIDGDDLTLEAAVAPPESRYAICCRATKPESWRCCGYRLTTVRPRNGERFTMREQAPAAILPDDIFL